MNFSNQLQIVALSAALFLTSAAHADLSRDELETISASEAGWAKSRAYSEGYEGSAEVYVTAAGTFRLGALPASYTASATLDLSKSGRQRGAKFAGWCTNSKLTFGVLARQQKKARYVYELQVFPLGSSINVESFSNAASFENKVSILRIDPVLQLLTGSNVVDSGSNKQEFLKLVNDQLARQADAVLNTGKATIVVDGWDDVACDLAQGFATLSFDVNLKYESPLVMRREVLNADQVQQVYSKVAKKWMPQSNLFKNYVWGGAMLGIALADIPNFQYFGVDNFINVYSEFFSLPAGELKKLSTQNLVESSRHLDQLVRGDTIATPKIFERLNVK